MTPRNKKSGYKMIPYMQSALALYIGTLVGRPFWAGILAGAFGLPISTFKNVDTK
jgi:hypothetical protein